MAKKRGEANGKGGKERSTYLNAEFQRIAKRDKKAFLCNQCKEKRKTIEWGRSFQENQTYQGNISCKDGLNKGQKWYGPTEADDIKKNGGKNTQKNCTKKIFMTQIITMV